MWPWTSHLEPFWSSVTSLVKWEICKEWSVTLSYSFDSWGLLTTSIYWEHARNQALCFAFYRRGLIDCSQGSREGWHDHPHLRERKPRLRKFDDLSTSRVWVGGAGFGFGSVGPRAQLSAAPSCSRKTSEPNQHGAFSLEKPLAWKIRPMSSQKPILLCFLFHSATMLSGAEGRRQGAGQASWQPAGS